MAIVVKHEKRRKEILEKVLNVFIAEGYENTTFQKIADYCGITRTTLYIYFKNKKEIFNYSIKLFLTKIDENLKSVHADSSLNSVEKLTKVLLDIFTLLEESRRLLTVVFDYILYTAGSANPEQRIHRRTLKLRHIFTALIIEGVRSGELKSLNIKTANDYLYSFIEAGIFRLVVLKKKTVGDLRKTAAFAVKQFAV